MYYYRKEMRIHSTQGGWSLTNFIGWQEYWSCQQVPLFHLQLIKGKLQVTMGHKHKNVQVVLSNNDAMLFWFQTMG